jgi:hypothetical protein
VRVLTSSNQTLLHLCAGCGGLGAHQLFAQRFGFGIGHGLAFKLGGHIAAHLAHHAFAGFRQFAVLAGHVAKAGAIAPAVIARPFRCLLVVGVEEFIAGFEGQGLLGTFTGKILDVAGANDLPGVVYLAKNIARLLQTLLAGERKGHDGVIVHTGPLGGLGTGSNRIGQLLHEGFRAAGFEGRWSRCGWLG